jgi:hypothetical protein
VRVNIENVDCAKWIKGIGGLQSVEGIAPVPIPFPDLNIMIEIDIVLLDGDTPSLLSLTDLKKNELDIDVLKDQIWQKGKCQSLSLINDFLVHK